MQGHSPNRIAVDVGGTFTDLIFVDKESGEVRVGKELSTPEAPARAVLTVVDAVVREKLRECRYFLHGTTVGLNAPLERKGAKVGLLATNGFRDVLEKRRSNYDEPWNPVWRPDAPVVPRRHRWPVRGRIAADGAVIEPLHAYDVRAAVDTFTAEAGSASRLLSSTIRIARARGRGDRAAAIACGAQASSAR